MDKKLILKALLEQSIDWERRMYGKQDADNFSGRLDYQKEFYSVGPYSLDHLVKRINKTTKISQADVKKALLLFGSVNTRGEYYISDKIIGTDGRLVTSKGKLVVRLEDRVKDQRSTIALKEPKSSTSEMLVSGFLHQDDRSVYLQPIDSRQFGDRIDVTNASGFMRSLVDSGTMVVVRTRPGRVDEPTCGYGEIVEVTDESVSTPAVGIASVFADGGYNETFPDDVMDEASKLPKVVTEADIEGMRAKYPTFEDWRDKRIVTIDPRTCKDMDDAVKCTILPNGDFELDVAIASVALYVSPDSALAREAGRRGNSTYVGDRVCAMFPKELSNNICSINPGEDRLALGGRFIISSTGEVKSSEFMPVVVRSRHKMAYDTVDSLFYGKDEELKNKYRYSMPNFEALKALDDVVRGKSKSNGFMELSDSEATFRLSADRTKVERVFNDNRTTAHKMVETAMLIYNEEFAKMCVEKNIPIIYRIEPHIDPEQEERVLKMLYSLNIPIEIDENYDIRKTINHAIEWTLSRDKANRERILRNTTNGMDPKLIDFYPLTHVVCNAIIRCLPKASYSAYNQGHFAAGKPVYTHMSSDIRRFCDLTNGWQFDAYLRGVDYPFSVDELGQIATHISETEYNSEVAERRGDRVIGSMFVGDHLLGKQVVASVSNTNENDMTFSWGAFDIVVPIKGSHGRYQYNKSSHYVLDKKTGAKLKFGRICPVIITAVDTIHGVVLGDLEYGKVKEKEMEYDLNKNNQTYEK